MTTKAADPLHDWTIYRTHGHDYLGHSRVAYFELVALAVQSPRGPALVHQVRPILCPLASVKSLRLSCEFEAVRFAELDPSERKQLLAGIEACEAAMRAQHAAQAGVLVAPAGAKLPPIAGALGRSYKHPDNL